MYNENSITNIDNINNIDEKIYTHWFSTLKDHGIVYLHGMFGSGKTTQALDFAKRKYKNYEYFQYNDSNILANIIQFIDDFKKIKKKTLLIIDDLQWLIESDEQKQLFSILIEQVHYDKQLQIMLISRASLPDYLVPLRITKRLALLDSKSLLLDKDQILSILSSKKELQSLSKTKLEKHASSCYDTTHGYWLWVQVFLQRLCEYPNDFKTASFLAVKDIYYQLDHILFSKWPSLELNALIKLSVYPVFSRDMANELLGLNADSIIKNIMLFDSLIRIDSPSTYRYMSAIIPYFTGKLSELDDYEEIVEIAARHYENQRNFKDSLHCYRLINRTDKITEIVVYLLENAEGCVFAELSEQYIDLLTPELEITNPSIIGAKAMLAAYRMDPKSSKLYLERLKSLTNSHKNDPMFTDILSVYIRTLIASPCVSANEMKENLLLCSDYVQQNGVSLKNIMPTGNFPSIINGGLDLLPWVPYTNTLFPIMKKAVTVALGVEGFGAPDTAIGEIYYEQNNLIKSMASLTTALSIANFKESIRVQYAITGIMARLFQCEGQLDISLDILHNIREKASQQLYTELLPNIDTSIIHCSLLTQNVDEYTNWINSNAQDEHSTFYITSRFSLLTKARVYTALDRTIEALYIIDNLNTYADLYHRPYMKIELYILKAIILYKRNDEWKTSLVEAIQLAKKYKLVRVFADQGAALLPLWKELECDLIPNVKKNYINTISKEMTLMARLYPKYLQTAYKYKTLTTKELEVLRLLAKGQNNNQIASSLNINLGTAKFHISNLMKKLNAENRTLVVKNAQDEGLI